MCLSFTDYFTTLAVRCTLLYIFKTLSLSIRCYAWFLDLSFPSVSSCFDVASMPVQVCGVGRGDLHSLYFCHLASSVYE